jgi:uroporphyrinogen-III synthase
VRLTGHRIVVCRSTHQAGPLLDAVVAEGAEPIHVPLIEVVPPVDEGEALRVALSTADRSTWVVVTSANGVDAVAHAPAAGSGSSRSQPWWLAVVGRATANRAREWNLDVAFESPEPSAAGLARSLPVRSGQRVIAAVAELAGPDLEEILRRRGVEVEVITAYRTTAPEISSSDRRRIIGGDLVLATSPSVVQRLHSAIDSADLPPMVAIGPTTAASIEMAGLSLSETAASPSTDALIEAAVRSLER